MTRMRLAPVIALAAALALTTAGEFVRAEQAVPPPGTCVGDDPAALAGMPEALSPFARSDVKAVAERITCYCGCPHLQVSACFCGTAETMRADIAARLDAGESADEVVAAFMAEHGNWILAVPPRSGFNWIIWIAPVALLVLGATGLLVMGRLWTRVLPAPSPVPPPLDPESEARHRERLRQLLEQGQ